MTSSLSGEGEPVDWKANFYRAYDALGMKTPDLLSSGMELCQKQHSAILRQVESVIEGTNGIRTTGAFRYVTIKDHPDQLYVQPMLGLLPHFERA